MVLWNQNQTTYTALAHNEIRLESAKMFTKNTGTVNFPTLEEQTLAFWKSAGIYEKTLKRRENSTNFVFFEGPPTANGMPHPGHCLTRAIKDVFPRYKTMRGFLCTRKAGWDTHGLPVEVEVCKELGIHSKEEIEEYGVEPFIQLCQKSVWRYMQEWEKLTERLGFWVDLNEAYVTYHKSYVESVWWSLKNLFDRGLLYQGHKIVWWWAQGGTALSAGEVGEGYRKVDDPSVYVRFPLVDDPDTSLLVWTTTPWTLPSNQFACVHPDGIDYVTVVDEEGKKLIVAEALLETIAQKTKKELTVESKCKGTDLVGKRYVPPFDFYHKDLGQKTGALKDGGEDSHGWRVVSADFVTTDSGTGIVHQAPPFGEIDYEVLVEDRKRFNAGEEPPMLCAVGSDGKFTTEASTYEGQWVKDADKNIIRDLKESGALFFQEQYNHDYPFCWRADEDPLIQYPRESWFIRTTEYKDELLANNREINWLPEHIKTGRFGNFLESNVDWALSRERYWGTPLPIWVCQETGKQEAVASYEELLKKPGISGTDVWEAAKSANPELPDDLKVHKPYIDSVTYDSPYAEGARMQRVTEVIDCWYDSGAMPFAQWGYPHTGKEQFADQFPADFISEAIDQTRGWFYSQTAISTLLFSEKAQKDNAEKTDGSALSVNYPHPFQNCIVLGLMMAEGYICAKCKHRHKTPVKKCESCGAKNVERRVEKMSKRLRNYSEPNIIFDKYGADALRWYFFANQPPWTSAIYAERAIRESIPQFLLTLWNTYAGFFVTYALMDEFDPSKSLTSGLSQMTSSELSAGDGYRPLAERGELDRWLITELNRTIKTVTERMDAYDNYSACSAIIDFVDSLSNWYVRRSRDRFWSKDKTDAKKLDAYWTLYECLLTTCKVVAPFVPFISDAMWRNLTHSLPGVFESVHLCDYPEADDAKIDEDLSRQMSLLRKIASLGLSARMGAKLKVRQPLASVKVILSDNKDLAWLQSHDEILRNELNVHKIEYVEDPETYISYSVVPNFRALGKKLGKLMPKVKKLLGETDASAMLAELDSTGKVMLDVEGNSIELTGEEIEVRLEAKDGWAAAQDPSCVVVLATELTDELLREGMARDLVRYVNDIRKEMDLEFNDAIKLAVVSDSEEVQTAIAENDAYIQSETQAVSLGNNLIEGCSANDRDLGESKVQLFVKKV